MDNIQVCKYCSNETVKKLFFFIGSEASTDVTCHFPRKCIHYYGCIWALASDSKFHSEFAYFMQKEVPLGW